MITSLFLSIPPGTFYDQMSGPLNFVEDFAGVSNWVMRTPRVIYTTDMRNKHTFTSERVSIESVNQPSSEERWRYFVITKGDGRRYYCTSQIYYERGFLRFLQQKFQPQPREIYREFWLPKCMVLMSELPYYKLQVNLLKVYKELRRQQPIITNSVNQSLYRVYLQLVEQGREEDWENFPVRQIQQSRQMASNIEFSFNYYLTMCNEHRLGEALFIEKKTNREVLHLYKLHSNLFYQLTYFFHLPFSSYSLRLILSAVLQEKQIIFASNNSNLTTLIIQTIMKMIMPLKWCYMYVPNLPGHLIEPAQQNFMPYIVGISKKYLNQIDSSQRVVVDIEQDRIIFNGELLLFRSNLSQYLLYQNSDSKNYLQWQKEIRIKSLMLVHEILQDCMEIETPKTQRSFRRSWLKPADESEIVSIQRLPSSAHLHQQKHLQFVEDLVHNSMMYKHFKEDTTKGLCEETYRLINLNRDQRKIYLNGKFNTTLTQAQYPARYDNQKKYIKHFDTINNKNRRLRMNRYSLNATQGPLRYQSVRPPGTQSLVSSQFLGSGVLAQSSIFS